MRFEAIHFESVMFWNSIEYFYNRAR